MFFCISTQYLTNALIIGRTRYHTFKLAAAFIQSLVVSWIRPFLQRRCFCRDYNLMYHVSSTIYRDHEGWPKSISASYRLST